MRAISRLASGCKPDFGTRIPSTFFPAFSMKHFACLCLGMALLAACHKDDDIIECAPSVVATFANLRAAAPPVQTYSFDLTQAQSIRTSNGATVAFGPSAFVLPNGNAATGQAQLRIREIYSVPDMILADMPTTAQSSRQVLISGGEFRIQVWQGSTRLRLAGLSPIGVVQRLVLTSPIPPAGLDTTPMLLWQQPFPAAGVPPGRDSTGWQLISGPSGIASTVPSAAGYYTASLPLDSLSNWNIDQFWHAYQNAGSSSVMVEVPTATTATVTHVYFRPVGFNGLARCYLASSAATRWTSVLPLGADVIAVVLQERDGQLYYGTERLTVGANSVATPPLQALTAAEIVQRVRQL